MERDTSGVPLEGEIEGHPSKTPPGEFEPEEGVYAV